MKNFQEFQEATRFKKEKGYDVGGTKKPASSSKDAVLDAVKKSIQLQEQQYFTQEVSKK